MSGDGLCMDEILAIAQLKRGYLVGLEVLMHLYQVKAVYAAYLIVHDRSLAEDVVQAAFLRVVDKIEQFDERRPFGSWFLRIVVNSAIDAAEQQTRWLPLEPETEGETPASIDWLTGDTSCPEDLIETKEIRIAVRKTLNQLSPEQRAVIVLRYFLEMSEADMADSLHRPPSTIKWWLHKARNRLKDLLRPLWNSRLGKTSEDLHDE